ncbi:hypothetical protein INR49_013706 [Caranx melampygus]|nr:hypothetical protein INR49_013706 [Caranx melampygus]
MTLVTPHNLLIDYQFTFSLIQEDDNHYTAINFMASPEQPNKNLDMSINASNNFNLNITWSVGSTVIIDSVGLTDKIGAIMHPLWVVSTVSPLSGYYRSPEERHPRTLQSSSATVYLTPSVPLKSSATFLQSATTLTFSNH